MNEKDSPKTCLRQQWGLHILWTNQNVEQQNKPENGCSCL